MPPSLIFGFRLMNLRRGCRNEKQNHKVADEGRGTRPEYYDKEKCISHVTPLPGEADQKADLMTLLFLQSTQVRFHPCPNNFATQQGIGDEDVVGTGVSVFVQRKIFQKRFADRSEHPAIASPH